MIAGSVVAGLIMLAATTGIARPRSLAIKQMPIRPTAGNTAGSSRLGPRLRPLAASLAMAI